ncbi:MAG: hypothetical protein U0168_21515 [Nannocystaceae bacterium]|nr:hypothetical protein [Nannocystaceae bacterium]
MLNIKEIATTLAILGSGALVLGGCNKDKQATEQPAAEGEKAAEGSCGEKKDGEGSCGEKKDGEASCGEKKAEGSCGEKAAEGSCGEKPQ